MERGCFKVRAIELAHAFLPARWLYAPNPLRMLNTFDGGAARDSLTLLPSIKHWPDNEEATLRVFCVPSRPWPIKMPGPI